MEELSSSSPGSPSTTSFLRQTQLDPRSTGYRVTGGVVSQLYRSIWTSIFSHISPAHLLPREVAPTVLHALVFLERCGWKLGNAQKRALFEINERQRENLGEISSTTSSAFEIRTPNKFVPHRQATPPPGVSHDELQGAEYGPDRKGMACGHIFREGEAIYRCRDCALDDTCVLCAPCFHASNHEGHDIVFNISSGHAGCCDCGDEEAWTRKVCCKYHDAESSVLASKGESSQSGDHEMDITNEDDYVRFTPDSSEKGKAPEKSTKAVDYVQQLQNLYSGLPVDAREGLMTQISSMATYILDTMEHAPPDTKLQPGPDALESIKLQPTLEPDESDEELLADRTLQPVGAYSFGSNSTNRCFAVILWNDEKHSFREVIDIVSDAKEVVEYEAKGIAERVDRHGREIIDISTEVRKLYKIAHKLAQIDLAVTIRPAYDVYAEEIAGHVLEILLDLTNSSLFVFPSQAQDRPAHPFDGLVPNAAAMRAVIGRTLLERWDHRKPLKNDHMSKEFFNSEDLVQLDGLFLMHHKLWKKARENFRSLNMSLIGPREVKRAVAFRFACMFAKLVEIFILHDREHEHSVRYIDVQLFSVPSIASELVENFDLFHKMLQILQSIFTNQVVSGSLVLPPSSTSKMRAKPQSALARQQRSYDILQNLRYVLGGEGVQHQLVQDTINLRYFLDFLSLFNAIAPDRRAISQHVEFESDTWITVVQVTTHLARLAKVFGEAYTKSSPVKLLSAIHVALEKILHSCSNLHQNDPDIHAAIAFDRVIFADRSYHIIDFVVENMGVSFYHPMHWLLSEILKAISTFSTEQLRELGAETFADLIPDEIGENGLLVLFDFPLRVMVKLAQIRSGLWVRNGFGIRSQAHHYRDSNMREIMLDQDIFLLQSSLVLVDPDRVLVSFIRRYSLLGWLKGGEVPETIDASQILSIAEELMLLLVTLLSETSMLLHRSIEDQVRTEIVHFLALNQGTYSELTRYTSDKLKDHPSYDRVLAQVSHFRAPDGTNDLGIFELKDEYYDEVQPFWFHYSRNQREKAEQVLKERQKRKSNATSAAKFVAVPLQQLSCHTSPFVNALAQVFDSPILLKIISSSFHNALQDTNDSSDGLIDATLQLLMMGLVERGRSFAQLLVQSDYEHKQNLLEMLMDARLNKNLTAFKPKMEWIIAEAARVDSQGCGPKLQDREHDGSSMGAQNEEASTEERRKASAKARQAAIMQKFSAQQKSLLDSLEDDDLEDDDAAMDFSKGDEQRPTLGSCIFCQEDLTAGQAFGSLAHIQGSRMLRNTPRHDAFNLHQSILTPLTLDRNSSNGKRVRGDVAPIDRQKGSSLRQWDGFSSEDRRFGFYASTCGHLMHLECFDIYCRSIEQRHTQQIARNHPEDLSRSEFVCPLCKSLGNVILPFPERGHADVSISPTSLTEWIRKINIDILKTSTSSLRTDMQETEHGTGCFTHWFAEDAQMVVESSLARGVDGIISHANQHMLERLCRVLKPLSLKSRATRVSHQSRTILAPPSRKMYIPEEVIAYTIAVLEVSQRGILSSTNASSSTSSKPCNVSGSLNEQTSDLIVALIQCLRDIAKLEELDYQSVLKHGLLMRLLPHWGGHDTVRSPLLLRDPMTILVETAIIVPENLRQVTVLMFYIQLVQVVFGIAQPSLWPQTGPGGIARGIPGLRNLGSSIADDEEAALSSAKDLEALKEVFDDVRGTVANIIGLVGYARGNITLGVDNLDDASLTKMICVYCLPFLRRSAILQKCMGVLPDETPNVAGGERPEFLRLMSLLSIPLPKEALSASANRQTALAGLVEGWIKHAYPQLASIFRPLPIQPSPLSSSVKSGRNHPHHIYHPMLQLEHPYIYELIQLPQNLTTMLMQCQNLKCKRCGDTPSDPAICMECGELLCFQSFCCQSTTDGYGECNRHLEDCGHSTGMFFKVKSNIIVLLSQGKGSFVYSPYLDSHGEIDIGLKKGKIQYLHQVRFDELRKQWLQHGLANMIARKIEALMDQGGWTTM